VILNSVDEKRAQRIREEIIHACAEETGTCYHPPFVPCVNGQSHDLCGAGWTKPHEIGCEKTNRLEGEQNYDEPAN
jgi:hypothetical protein